MRNELGSAAIFFIILIAGTLYFAVSEALKGRNVADLFLIRPTSPAYESPRGPEPIVQFEPLPSTPPPSGPVKPSVTPPRGFTAEQLSPFYDEVRINSISPARDPGGKSSFSLIAVSYTSPVSVTGWALRGRTGQAVSIPQAVSDYNPFSFPLRDIVLDPGGVVYVFSHASGFGTNIRLNDCMGYFNDVYAFDPRLPVSCPRPFENSELIDFSGTCQEFLRSLGNCEVPNAQKKVAFQENDRECILFMEERVGYNQCYKKHRNDKDFLSENWYVWLGRAMPFDSLHDRVFLFDKEGLLVDEYVY